MLAAAAAAAAARLSTRERSPPPHFRSTLAGVVPGELRLPLPPQNDLLVWSTRLGLDSSCPSPALYGSAGLRLPRKRSTTTTRRKTTARRRRRLALNNNGSTRKSHLPFPAPPFCLSAHPSRASIAFAALFRYCHGLGECSYSYENYYYSATATTFSRTRKSGEKLL